MAQTPENKAAWMPASQVTPLEVGPAPYTPAGPGQLVVKNRALGINPIDWVKQMLGDNILGHVKYPATLGEDLAGEVVEVGEGVKNFKVGDRVLALGNALLSNVPSQGAFQLYTVTYELSTTKLPENISFEQGAALPLAILTASQGLFGILGLDTPTVPARDGKSSRAVLVAGGSSALGGTAVQLAAAAGYDVISTASPKNFDHVKRLGASRVFDYKSATLADDLLAAVKGKQLSGAFAIGDGTADIFADVLNRHDGPTHKVIARAEGKHSVDESSGVKVEFIINDISPNSPARQVFTEYLPKALAEGQFVPAPEPQVVGQGLEKLQDAFLAHKQGVSAKKIVVTL